MMLPFVSLGLKVCEKLEIQDTNSQKMIMRFCKMYTPEKIAAITHHALAKPWCKKNPKAAFMMSVGEINKLEKSQKES